MKTSFAASAIGVVISLGLAACESPSSPDTDASASPSFTAGGGGGAEKVAVCHVGTQQPAYDPTCPTCGDAGKVDLLFLPASIAAKHLEQGHDGQLVDYDPFAEGATGVGQEDTTDDGKYVDDGCVIPGEPEEEIIYAVAYMDQDPNDGPYNPNVDLLIAKVIENSGDNAVNVGDLLITQYYPTDFSGSFEPLAITEHRVLEVLLNGPYALAVRIDNQSADFYRADGYEWYQEVGLRITDGLFYDPVDAIATAIPSIRGITTLIYISESNATDEQFLDVEIYY